MKKIINIAICGLLIVPLSTSALTKTESVFNTLNTDGKIEKSIITNHIKINTKEELLDNSDLQNIKNINGNETFKQDGYNLVWKSNGKDIYYQGTSTKEQPLEINIKYFLNDEEKSLADILGKKGDIKIPIDFTNKEKNALNINGKIETIYTPFVVMAGTIIDSKNNSDIKVTNGKVVETGSKSIIASISSPGLYESLNINSKSLDKIEIKYKTNKFSLNNIYIIATPKLIEESDLTGFNKINSLLSNVDKLQTSMNEIETGALTLSNGMNELKEGVNSLENGTEQLYNGMNKLSTSLPSEDNNEKNEQALNYLKNNNNTAVESLSNAITQLEKQQKEITKQIEAANSKKEYVDNQINTVESNLETVINTYNSYYSKLEQLNIEIKDLESKLSGDQTTEAIKNKLTELKAQKQSLETIVLLLKNQIEALNGTKEALNGTITSISGTLQLLLQTNDSINININANKNLITLISGNNKVVDTSINTIDSMRKLSIALNDASSATYKINNGTKNLKTGTEKLENGTLTLSNGISQFNKEGINKLTNYSTKIKYYKNKVEALMNLSKTYKGFSSNNSRETLFINKVKSSK